MRSSILNKQSTQGALKGLGKAAVSPTGVGNLKGRSERECL